MSTNRRSPAWTLPAACVAIGVVMLIVLAAAGEALQGLGALGVMAAVAAGLVLGGRSETVRGFRGDGRDERFAAMDQRASAVTCVVLALALVAGWLTEIARGGDGSPWGWLVALGAGVYVVSVVVLHRRM